MVLAELAGLDQVKHQVARQDKMISSSINWHLWIIQLLEMDRYSPLHIV